MTTREARHRSLLAYVRVNRRTRLYCHEESVILNECVERGLLNADPIVLTSIGHSYPISLRTL